MRINVNLATRPFADLGPILRTLRIAMLVLVLVALALGGGVYMLHTKANAVRAREHGVDASINKVQTEQQGYRTLMAQPANAQVLDHTEALNRLFDEKSFSWTLTMEDLETVLPGGVQVTTLDPIRDKKDGHITLRMRVVGPRDKAVDLVKNLEHSRRFIQPRITGESSEAPSGANNQQLQPVSASSRVNVELMADYNPATRAERKAPVAKAEKTSSDTTEQHHPRGRMLRAPSHTTKPSAEVAPHAGGAQ